MALTHRTSLGLPATGPVRRSRRGALAARLALAAAALLLAAPAPALAGGDPEELPPPPPQCPPGSLTLPDSSDYCYPARPSPENDYGQRMRVNPKIVPVGGTLVAEAIFIQQETCGGFGGSVCSREPPERYIEAMPGGQYPRGVISDRRNCKAREAGTGSNSRGEEEPLVHVICSYTALKPDTYEGQIYWTTFPDSADDPSGPHDIFLVVPKGRAAISGYVCDSQGLLTESPHGDSDFKPRCIGDGVSGISVKVDGPTSRTVKTGGGGFYSAAVRPGSYRVKPEGKGPYTPPTSSFKVPVGQILNKNFVCGNPDPQQCAEKGTNVSVLFQPGSLNASGFGLSIAQVKVEDETGVPVRNQELDIQPDLDEDAPGVVICEATARGKLLWPWLSRYPDGTRPKLGFRRVRTDADGRLDLKVLGGTSPGVFSLSARIPGKLDEGRQLLPVLANTSRNPPRAPAPALTELVEEYFSGSNPRLGLALQEGGSPLRRQLLLLELLALARDENAIPFRGYSFGPIRRSDGRAGILLYERGVTVRTSGGDVGRGLAVIDVVRMSEVLAIARSGQGFRPPNFENPSTAGALVSFEDWRGEGAPPVVGYAEPQPTEDLMGFGFPERPSQVSPARDDFDACLGAPAAPVIAEIHSPVRAVLTGAGGRQVGQGPSGPLLEVPGALVIREKGAQPGLIAAPPGAYSLNLTGTGAGRATVVLRQPGVPLPSVFTFTSRKGAKGTLSVPARSSPQKLTFAGRTIRAQRGVRLRVKGIPRRLRRGRRTLAATVTDQFGRAVSGAILRVGKARAATDARGRGRIVVNARRRKLKLTVEAIGHRPATLTVSVR